MAATNELNVKIGAEADGLNRGLSEAAKAIAGFEKEAQSLQVQLAKNSQESKRLKKDINSLTASFKKGDITNEQYEKSLNEIVRSEKNLAASTSKLKTQLASVNAKSQSLSGGVSKLGKTTANAVPAMTSFSQVIQDAPFGIVGVSNNITQLTSQFGYLKKSTGSSSAALKAMLGTLSGPGGILLAVSAVTSLLVVFGGKLSAIASDSKKLASATKEYIKEANTEIVSLKQLVSIAKDENNSKKVRQRAVDDINEKYGEYLGNLDLEKVKTEAVAKSVNDLAKSLILKAKVAGVADLISEKTAKNAEKLIKLDLERNRLTEKQEKATKKLAESETGREKAINKRTLFAVNDALSKTNKEITKLTEESDKAVAPLLKLQKTLQETFFETEPVDGSNTEQGVKDTVTTLTTAISQIQPLTEQLNNQLASAIPSWQPQLDQQKLELEAMAMQLQAFNNTASAIIQGGINNTFASMAQSIGNAFASGENAAQAGGAAILGSIGGILVQYGKLVLATGIASQAFKTAITNPFGGGIGAIIAGGALIAAGAAVKGFAAKQASSASSSTASTTNVSGSTGQSSFSGGNSSFSGGSNSLQNVVFEIQGTKLVGVLSNTLNRNRSLNGTLSIN